MSGSPTEAEIQTQWKNGVAMLESIRNYADGTVAAASGLLDTIEQAVEGEYLPVYLPQVTRQIRAGFSSMLDPQVARSIIEPVLFEYGPKLTAGLGGNYSTSQQLARALYEYYAAGSVSVKSRAISYGSASAGGSNVGNYSVSRLTVDENGYNLEACTVETKVLRCRQDRNTGAQQNAEVFEVMGAPRSQDNLLRSSYGSGDTRATIIAMHAGSSTGGSLLNNSTFSAYSSTSSPKFSQWTETAGGAQLSQDTTNYYRSAPGSTTDASLKMTGGGGTVTITQTLDQMRAQSLDFTRPYLFRVMLNKTIGTASGGTVTITCGSKTASISIASLGSGWQELIIAIGQNCWPKQFNQNGFSIAISWTSSSSGYLLVDDAIFAPWTFVDGTYWSIRPNGTSVTNCLVDDKYTVADTGGAPSSAKLQYYFWLAGLGYLPSSGTPTISDP